MDGMQRKVKDLNVLLISKLKKKMKFKEIKNGRLEEPTVTHCFV